MNIFLSQFPRAIVLFLLLHKVAIGACDPDTVQFYLDKGFTQEQITALCVESNNTSPEYQPYQKPVVIYQQGDHIGRDGLTAEENKALAKLKNNLAARSVEITDTRINFIAPVCLVGGNSPELDQRIKHCSDVAYSVAREGLAVTQGGQKYLVFGSKRLEITSSDIIRKHTTADPWSGISPDIKYSLQNRYKAQNKGNSMDLPLVDSADINEIADAIKTISAIDRAKSSGDNRSEVSKILDDDYQAPSEESSSTKTKIPNAAAEKKGRWWNPFD
jgi:hypothetical protein